MKIKESTVIKTAVVIVWLLVPFILIFMFFVNTWKRGLRSAINRLPAVFTEVPQYLGEVWRQEKTFSL